MSLDLDRKAVSWNTPSARAQLAEHSVGARGPLGLASANEDLRAGDDHIIIGEGRLSKRRRLYLVLVMAPGNYERTRGVSPKNWRGALDPGDGADDA